MLDKNIVMLEGVIGDDMKYGKSTNGKEYMTCSLVMNSFFSDMADDTERTHSLAYIRIFAYDKRILEYLRAVKAHQGVRASVFGRLTSFRSEVYGHPVIVNSVICRDMMISKTRKDGHDEELLDFRVPKTGDEDNNKSTKITKNNKK